MTTFLDAAAIPAQATVTGWVDACSYDELLVERAVCVPVPGGAVALVLTYGGDLHAVGNVDPFCPAGMTSREITGTRVPPPTVAAPMFEPSFDLRTGVCLDDPSVCLPVYPVRREAGRVLVGLA